MTLQAPLLALACLPLAALAVPVEPVAVPYKDPSHSNPLGTTFVAWASLLARPTAVGELRAVFDNPTPTLDKFEVHVTTLRPGMASHPVHQHPWEEMLLIKEGRVEVSINGQPHPAGTGSLIFLAAHDPHNLTNIGTQPATYFVINFCTNQVHSGPGLLPSSVIDCDGLKAVPNANGSRTAVIDAPTRTFVRLSSHITTLNPGRSTAPDIIDTGDELFVLKAGTLEATVNSITCRLNSGSFFYCAPRDRRTFRNLGAGPAAYQVIKVVSERTPR